MPHATPLIATIVAGLVLALLLGTLAHRLRLSPLIGYLLAGVIVGPSTPGWVANQALANELAEIGVILLMFGVGLHFSMRDLLSVRRVAIPGAIGQIVVATAFGIGLAMLMGWTLAAGLVFGLALSVASTVVMLRALQQRSLIDTERGRIAVGWLIVEDLVMVLALVLLPALADARGGGAGASGLLAALAVTIGKVAGFVAFMMIVGRRVIPWALHEIAHTGSRELFRLAVLAIALGVAFGAAMLFGVSFALGAFFAGMILSESKLSQRAAQETLPLRDAFAVLFFVSVGMLFNPAVLLSSPGAFVATLTIILVVKSVAAFAIVRAFGRTRGTALTIAASLAQVGEFSFILATLGVGIGILPAEGRDLILGGAMLSIMVNPLLFVLADRIAGPEEPVQTPEPLEASGHVILVGHGRVGSSVSAGLIAAGRRFAVVEARHDARALDTVRAAGERLIVGNAASADVLRRTDPADASLILVAIPDGFEAGQVVAQARALNPSLRIVARAHSEEESAHLIRLGADRVIVGEIEISNRMLEDAARGPVMRARMPAASAAGV